MPDNPTPIRQNYAVQTWSNGYFSISPQGHVLAHPDQEKAKSIDLYDLSEQLNTLGLSLPVLVRFTDILRHRVTSLQQGFHTAITEHQYEGVYQAIYPTKVNQQRCIIDQLANKTASTVGLEVGSKAELMAALAISATRGTLVCNGYKDRDYIRLALCGQQLGHNVYITIEKPTDTAIILNEAKALGIKPLLGVRVRTQASALGNWQNSGGERSKFGLNATQLLNLIEELTQADALQHLQLLHAHLGSQIPDLADIRNGMQEVAQFYAELHRLNVPIDKVDVGGGLGVDYEGTGSKQYCSMNYSLSDYANTIVSTLSHICTEQNLAHPDIFTESGRALTAHHAVLITHVVARETSRHPQKELAQDKENFSVAQDHMNKSQQQFQHGEISLQQRAKAEQEFNLNCRHLLSHLEKSECDENQAMRATLRKKLADKLVLNFSLFQSAPDIWGIEQIFPILPLHRLNETATCHGVIHDLTCDSDGSIERYVTQEGIENSLPIATAKSDEPYLFGIFLLGAYQEILGDMHNLFGATHTVNLELNDDGGYHLLEIEKGDTVEEILRYIHFNPATLRQSYREKIRQANLSEKMAQTLYATFAQALQDYSYHEDA